MKNYYQRRFSPIVEAKIKETSRNSNMYEKPQAENGVRRKWRDGLS